MIIHQSQPTHNSCVSACIAMLAGVPATEVTERFNDAYHSQEDPNIIFRMLEAYNIEAVPRSSHAGNVHPGQVVIACVPSLNIVGGNHAVILDYSTEEFKVFDPAEGIPGKKFYTTETLGGFTIDFNVFSFPAKEN